MCVFIVRHLIFRSDVHEVTNMTKDELTVTNTKELVSNHKTKVARQSDLNSLSRGQELRRISSTHSHE